MQESRQSNWAYLPGAISRRIRFKQLQACLKSSLEACPKPDVDLELCQVYVAFDICSEKHGHNLFRTIPLLTTGRKTCMSSETMVGASVLLEKLMAGFMTATVQQTINLKSGQQQQASE